MKINPNAGGNGKAHRMAGPRLVQSKGGIILPEADAHQQAQDEAKKWDNKMVAWCPIVGYFEIPSGTLCERRPHPFLPGVFPIWAECSVCSTVETVVHHCANMVLALKAGDTGKPRPPTPVVMQSCAELEQCGRKRAEQCVELFPGVAAFHIQREDSDRNDRKVASLVISAMDSDFDLIEADGDRTTTAEVMVDADDKFDLTARVRAYTDGLESVRPVLFGPYDYCKKVWEESQPRP